MHALKLALNKSMRASDDEQGVNKLRPNGAKQEIFHRGGRRRGKGVKSKS